MLLQNYSLIFIFFSQNLTNRPLVKLVNLRKIIWCWIEISFLHHLGPLSVFCFCKCSFDSTILKATRFPYNCQLQLQLKRMVNKHLAENVIYEFRALFFNYTMQSNNPLKSYNREKLVRLYQPLGFCWFSKSQIVEGIFVSVLHLVFLFFKLCCTSTAHT